MAMAVARLMRRQAGDAGAAVESLTQAQCLGLDSADLHHQLGVAFLARGAFDHAVSESQIAIKMKPEFAAAHLNLGLAHRARLEMDDARRCLERAVELQSGSARAWEALANASGAAAAT